MHLSNTQFWCWFFPSTPLQKWNRHLWLVSHLISIPRVELASNMAPSLVTNTTNFPPRQNPTIHKAVPFSLLSNCNQMPKKRTQSRVTRSFTSSKREKKRKTCNSCGRQPPIGGSLRCAKCIRRRGDCPYQPLVGPVKTPTVHYDPAASSNPLDGFLFSGTVPTSVDLPQPPIPDPTVCSCRGIMTFDGPKPNELVEAVAAQAQKLVPNIRTHAAYKF